VSSLRKGSTRLLGTALVLGVVSGCTWPEWMERATWQDQFRTHFSPLNPEDENIAQVDVATMKWRRGDAQLEADLWTELDEQFIHLDQRRQLARHGLRLGLMRSATGSRLQAAITNPLNAADFHKNHPDAGSRLFAAVNDKLVAMAPSKTTCTVEARRVVARSEHDLFWPTGPKSGPTKLLVLEADRQEAVRQTDQLELGFSVRLQKMPDAQTLVRLVPVAKYSINAQGDWSDAFFDALRNKTSFLKHEVRFDPLAVEVVLGHDQYLVLTAQKSNHPDAEAWGELAFVNHENDQQTVLVIRGASVESNRSPSPPRKGQAWPLAWQAAEIAPPSSSVERKQ
jgi:hypothetical protein